MPEFTVAHVVAGVGVLLVLVGLFGQLTSPWFSIPPLPTGSRLGVALIGVLLAVPSLFWPDWLASEPDADVTASKSPRPPAQKRPALSDAPGVLADATIQIEQILREYHAAIVGGDFDKAWLLTSVRHRQRLRRQGVDKATWAASQSELVSYLEPAGLRVSIRELDRETGVATVDVSGMTWTKPNSRCTAWGGVTWAKYERELKRWRYDPGFSATSSRRLEWQPRHGETLGAAC